MSYENNGSGNRANEGTTISLKIAERGLYERAKELYSSKYAFLREAFQNASDSGAKKFDIYVRENKITISDDGTGMSRRFMIEQFKKVGEKFKEADKKGAFGVGRLSFWMPIIHEDREGNVVYRGNIEIITNYGKRATYIKWDSLPHYTVEDAGPTTENGTTIVINFSEEASWSKERADLEAKNIGRYMKNLVLENGTEIEVNGEEVRPEHAIEKPTTRSSGRFFNTAINGRRMPKYYYDIQMIPGMGEFIVAEKGITVVRNSTYGGLGGIINFKDGIYKGEHVSIMPLNRDRLLLDFDEVYYTFLFEGFRKYLPETAYEKAKGSPEEIARAAIWLAKHSPKETRESRALVRRAVGSIEIEGRTLAAWSIMKDVAWYQSSASENRLANARKKGYHLLEIDDEHISNALEIAKIIPNVYSMKMRKRSRKNEETESEDSSGVLHVLKKYIALMVSIEKGKELRANIRKQALMQARSLAQRTERRAKALAIRIARGGVAVAEVIALAPVAGILVVARGIELLYSKVKHRLDARYERLKKKAEAIAEKNKEKPEEAEIAALREQIDRQLNADRTTKEEDDSIKAMLSSIHRGMMSLLGRGGKAAKAYKRGPSDLTLFEVAKILIVAWMHDKKEYIATYSSEKEEKIQAREGCMKEKREVNAIKKEEKLIEREKRWTTMRKEILEAPSNAYGRVSEWVGAQDKLKEEARSKKEATKQETMMERYRVKNSTDDNAMTNIAKAIRRMPGRLLNQRISYDEKISAEGIVLKTTSLNEVKKFSSYEKAVPTLGRGNTILLNTDDAFVKKALDEKRPDLLLQMIVRQYALNLGYRNESGLLEAELRILDGVASKLAEREVAVTGTTTSSDGKEFKTVIPQIELTKEDIAKVQRNNSKKVQVIVTPRAGKNAPDLMKLREN